MYNEYFISPEGRKIIQIICKSTKYKKIQKAKKTSYTYNHAKISIDIVNGNVIKMIRDTVQLIIS